MGDQGHTAEAHRQVYETLKALLLAHSPGMRAHKQTATELHLIAPMAHPLKPGEPVWFGAVRLGKAYASYHLMPLYTHPAMAALVPDQLKPRMQGKSCFNFKKIEPERFEALADLTRRCAQAYAGKS